LQRRDTTERKHEAPDREKARKKIQVRFWRPEKSLATRIQQEGCWWQQKRPANQVGTPLHDKKGAEDRDMRKEEKVVENPAN